MPRGFNFFPLSSLRDTRAPRVSPSCPLSLILFLRVRQEKLIPAWRTTSVWEVASIVYLQSPRLSCPFHWLPQGSLFCALPVASHTGLLEPARRWICIYHLPLVTAREAHTMNFTEVYDWSPTAQNSLLMHLLWDKQADILKRHEWIGNTPVPEDKSITGRRGCSGKTFSSVAVGRLGLRL